MAAEWDLCDMGSYSIIIEIQVEYGHACTAADTFDNNVLQITVQLKLLSLARDFHRVSTKISGKLQKSFLAVEMVK